MSSWHPWQVSEPTYCAGLSSLGAGVEAPGLSWAPHRVAVNRHQGLTHPHNSLKNWQQVLHVADLLIVNENIRLLENTLHAFGIDRKSVVQGKSVDLGGRRI